MTIKEEAISVEGNVTPITKKPIYSINANQWHKMSVTELYDQLSVLHNRLVIANQLGNYALLQQLQVGVAQLQSVIENKSEQAEDPKR